MNPNDTVRKQILQYFYERNRGAKSQHGKKGSAVKISDAKRDLKTIYGLKQENVISNLNYLMDRGWVNKTEVQKTVVVKGGTIPSTVTWYQISARGIDKIEGGSQFEPEEPFRGINISAAGTNVITLGDGNVVNVRFSELRTHLDELKTEISSCPALEEKQKLDLVADIETVKDQLAKESPDKTIVGRLWLGIDRAASLAGLADAVHKVWPHIQSLIGG
jgi:hypothetical protein